VKQPTSKIKLPEELLKPLPFKLIRGINWRAKRDMLKTPRKVIAK